MNEKFIKFLEQQKEVNTLYVKWLIKNEILTVKDILIIAEELEEFRKLWIEEQRKLKLNEESPETTLLRE